jgi:hypothetical protein
LSEKTSTQQSAFSPTAVAESRARRSISLAPLGMTRVKGKDKSKGDNKIKGESKRKRHKRVREDKSKRGRE